MSGDQVVTVAKAVPHYNGHEVPSRTIAITEPGTELHGEDVVARAAAHFQEQAALVHEALTAALPGGTLSQLFSLMAADRASIFRVLDPAARLATLEPEPEPEPDPGIWVAYYDDLSEVVPCASELDAYRRADGTSMEVIRCKPGVGVREQLQSRFRRARAERAARDAEQPADGDVVDATIDWEALTRELQAQRAAVLAIHKPYRRSANVASALGVDPRIRLCRADDDVVWPCPTALALGVTDDA